MPKVYVGIYSSAWETSACAESEDAKLIGNVLYQESININISIKHAWETVNKVVDMALEKGGLNPQDPNIEINVGLGIKNTELVEACMELKKQNKRFKNFKIAADGHVLLRGSHSNDGAIIILDDGIVGNAISANNVIKIGGWGFPHADKGSIPWIGLEAIKLTIQWLDGFIEPSPLLNQIFQYFKNDVSNLVKWAMCSRTDPKEYNNICDIVLECTEKEDKNALLLIKQTAFEANKLFLKILEKLSMNYMPCALHGRLVPYAKNFLSEDIKKNLIIPAGDGVSGALNLARKQMNEYIANNHMMH